MKNGTVYSLASLSKTVTLALGYIQLASHELFVTTKGIQIGERGQDVSFYGIDKIRQTVNRVSDVNGLSDVPNFDLANLIDATE